MITVCPEKHLTDCGKMKQDDAGAMQRTQQPEVGHWHVRVAANEAPARDTSSSCIYETKPRANQQFE